jgi:hypothetical protein
MTRYLQALTESAAGVGNGPDRVRLLAAAHAKALEKVFGTDDEQWRGFDKAFSDSVQR